MSFDPFSQEPYQCRPDWGPTGTERAVSRGDIIVVVDTLSFSTATILAVSRGAQIYPCAKKADSLALANRIGATTSVERKRVPIDGAYSLSPQSFLGVTAGERIVLTSPNGAACSEIARVAEFVFCGALVNATATSAAITRLLHESPKAVTVIACGETEKDAPASRRMAIEDYLAAGAIISRLGGTKSPEAQVAEAAFCGSQGNLLDLLLESMSGRELCDMGFESDVRLSAQIDSYNNAVVARDGCFTRFSL